MPARSGLLFTAAVAASISWCTPAVAQGGQDRGDAAVAAEAGQAPAERSAPVVIGPSRTRAAMTASMAEAVQASAIVVEGAHGVPPNHFLAATAPFTGRPLASDDLKALATEVANVLRGQGFAFATAWVAPQRLDHGILRVSADPGRIHEVRILGEEPPGIARALRRFAEGSAVSKGRLERALLLAGDLPGVDIRDSRYSQEEGRGILTVEPDYDRANAFVSLDNHGADSTGPVRLRARASFNDVAFGSDQVTVRATVTPLDPRELATLGGEYSLVLNGEGTVASLGASVTRVRPGERYRRLDLDSRSISVNAGITQPLMRSLEANLWASADLSFRDSEQNRSGALVRDDRVAAASIGLNGYALVRRGWLSGPAELSPRAGSPGRDTGGRSACVTIGRQRPVRQGRGLCRMVGAAGPAAPPSGRCRRADSLARSAIFRGIRHRRAAVRPRLRI